MWWNFLLKISRNFDLFQLPDRKNLTFIQHLRASTHFVTIITTSDGFFCQFHINLEIFSWMLDYLLKNWNLFQSFCFTLCPNLKNFSVLLKARSKIDWTLEDFQVSTVFVDIIARPRGGKFKLSTNSVGKNKRILGQTSKIQWLHIKPYQLFLKSDMKKIVVNIMDFIILKEHTRAF